MINRKTIVAILIILDLGAFFIFQSLEPKTEAKPQAKPQNKVQSKTEEKPLVFPQAMPNPAKTLRVPVLMYHYVEDSPASSKLRAELQVNPQNFREQLDFLKSRGYESIRLEDLFRALYWGKQIPAKSIVLTFDDGYRDAYDFAFPILKEKGMLGTFFLITNYLDRSAYLSRDEVKEMADYGIEIGSHSQNHPDLGIAPLEIAKSEIENSKKELETLTGKKIYFFAYPGGKYNSETINILKDAGYLMALTTKAGSNHSSDNPFELTRIRVSGIEPLEKFKETLGKL